MKTGAAYEKHSVPQVENVLFQGVFHDEMYVSKLLHKRVTDTSRLLYSPTFSYASLFKKQGTMWYYDKKETRIC